MKYHLISLCVFCMFLKQSAQCQQPVLFSESTLNQIQNPYQFNFLHKISKNKVDSLVNVLLTPVAKSLINEAELIEAIAKTKTKEAFELLYVACIRPTNTNDLNLYAMLADKIVRHGGHRLLNNYFFNCRVQSSLPEVEFRSEVMKLCKKKKCKIYFCNQLPKEIFVEMLQQKIDSTFSEYQPCQNPIRVTDKNILEIHNPYELTFLHKIPKNRVDSILDRLLNANFKSAAEGINAVKDIAAYKSKEGFCFLYLCSALEGRMDIGNNLLHNICNQVLIWGGAEVLNAEYLNNEVDTKLKRSNFINQILDKSEKLKYEFYYCHQPTIMELYLQEVKDLKPEKYDKDIIRIINKNSNLNNNNSISKIVSQTLKLPYVVDVLWDGCYEKYDIYPEYFNLMVKMNISGKIIQRNYSMNGARFRYIGLRLGKYCSIGRIREVKKNTLDFKACNYSPGAIEAAKKYCEQVKERRNLE